MATELSKLWAYLEAEHIEADHAGPWDECQERSCVQAADSTMAAYDRLHRSGGPGDGPNRFYCNSCHHRWSGNLPFGRMPICPLCESSMVDMIADSE
jgi:hypothetical protein